MLLGQVLLGRLPMVFEALLAGRIDAAKASAFADALSGLDDETARAVATRLLAKAGESTLTQLREKLRYHVDRADPEAARRRYKKKVADREVWLHDDVDGVASLGGSNLAPQQAMAAYDRVDRIARAARSAGDPRTLAQLRADVFTAVLAGNPFHTIPPTDPLTRQADAEYPARPDPDEDEDGPVSRSGNGNPAEPDEWEPIGVATFGDAEPPDLDSRFREPGMVTAAGGRSNGPGRATPPGPNPGLRTGIPSPAADPTPQPAGNRCACGGIQPKFRRGVVDIQVKLSTLAELDNDPALIPGWGPVIADIARQVAHDQKANPSLEVVGHRRERRTAAPRPHPPPPQRHRRRLRPSPRPQLPRPRLPTPGRALRDRPPRRTGAAADRRTAAISTPDANTTTVSAANPATPSPAPTTASDGPHPTAAATTSAPTRTSSSPPTTECRPTNPHRFQIGRDPMWRNAGLASSLDQPRARMQRPPRPPDRGDELAKHEHGSRASLLRYGALRAPARSEDRARPTRPAPGRRNAPRATAR